MVYRSFADLSNLIRTNIHKIPHDIDVVVGIPRSGMLPANLIALYLNKRMTDIDSFVEGRLISSGDRDKYIQKSTIHKVLVVDDSVDLGGALKKARNKLQPLEEKYDFIYLTPIVSPIGKDMVDIYFEILDGSNRIFEWNFFHHSFLKNACMDIDGVLNVDPEIDDDGPIYTDYIEHATPLHIPTVPVDTLVTCRLEKYRPQTEKWLGEHNVQYNKLIMLDMPDKASRVAWNKHGEYKGEIYKKGKYSMFVESSLWQAKIIADTAHKEVFCVETNSFIQPNWQIPSMGGAKYRIKEILKKLLPRLFHCLSSVYKKCKTKSK